MKKNIIYLLILAALALVAYFAFGEKEEVFSKEDANFKVKNTQAITKIFLSDPGVGNIKLTKNMEGVWFVNDSMRARQDWVKFLLEGMAEQNPVQPVPQSAHNTAVKALAGNSVKVEVYKGDEKTNAYYVGKDPNDDNLTLMLNIREDGSNAPRPYYVKLGHTSTFLGVRYKAELEEWRDKQILNFPNSKLNQIEISYRDKPNAGFTMNINPSLSVAPAPAGSKLNQLRAEKYRSFYDKLFCYGFENDYILKDTFRKAFKPFAQIKVTSVDQQQHQLDIYYRQVNKTTHNVIKVDGVEYDGDSFFAWYDNKDFILLPLKTVQLVLRERQEFFKTSE